MGIFAFFQSVDLLPLLLSFMVVIIQVSCITATYWIERMRKYYLQCCHWSHSVVQTQMTELVQTLPSV